MSTDLTTEVAGWVEEGLQRGLIMQEATAEALRQVVRRGKSSEFVTEFGQRAAYDAWQKLNQRTRVEGANGERRYATELLSRKEPLLDGMRKVGAGYMRVRDMQKGDCREVAEAYSALAEANMHQANFFNRIADKLRGGQTVGSRFNEEQLREVAARGVPVSS